MNSVDKELLDRLRLSADQLDKSGDWPTREMEDLAAAGAMRWSIAKPFGGDDLSPLELHLQYETLAEASLAAALIVSQRDSAAGFIESADDWPARDETLTRMAKNEVFATIGIAQLTTSRQRGAPALTAQQSGDNWIIDGVIPWATGAAKSDFIIAGAVLSDQRQILFQLPTDSPGVTVGPPLPLVALRSTWTCQIVCDKVTVPSRNILRGPAERALVNRTRSLPLGQAFLATGLCKGALRLIESHGSASAANVHERFQKQLAEMRARILDLSQPGREADASAASPDVRGACNDLAIRITHAAVALFKGSALLAGHPAQRLAREAMFLLVWSCPNPVLDCTIDLLSKSER